MQNQTKNILRPIDLKRSKFMRKKKSLPSVWLLIRSIKNNRTKTVSDESENSLFEWHCEGLITAPIEFRSVTEANRRFWHWTDDVSLNFMLQNWKINMEIDRTTHQSCKLHRKSFQSKIFLCFQCFKFEDCSKIANFHIFNFAWVFVGTFNVSWRSQRKRECEKLLKKSWNWKL